MIGQGISSSLAWACLVCAAGVSLGQEQRLVYHSSADPGPVTGAPGRLEQAADQAPPGVALPTFQTDRPLFFRWQAKSPVGPGTEAKTIDVWFALDRSSQTGPYDLLYADSNLDGSLGDETPLKATSAAAQKEYQRAQFDLVKVLLPGEDGPAAYHVNVQFRLYERNASAYLISACWYEGMVAAGDKQVWCAVIDADVNGRFDDTSARFDQADRIRIAAKAGESYTDWFQDTSVRPLAKQVDIDGKLYPVTVAADGSSITLSPAVEVPTGAVRVGKSISQVRLFSPEGYVIRPATDGLAHVPQGEYTLVLWQASRKDDKGAAWILFAVVNRPEQAPKVTVRAGKEAALDIGEPLIASLEAIPHPQPAGEFTIRQQLTGRQGEYVLLLRDGARPEAPKVRIVSSNGTYDKTFALEYG